MDPQYAGDIEEINPPGELPTTAFSVFQFFCS